MKSFRNQRADVLLIPSVRYVFGPMVDGVAFVSFGIQQAGQKKPLPSSLQRVLVRKELTVSVCRTCLTSIFLLSVYNMKDVTLSNVALCSY